MNSMRSIGFVDFRAGFFFFSDWLCAYFLCDFDGFVFVVVIGQMDLLSFKVYLHSPFLLFRIVENPFYFCG